MRRFNYLFLAMTIAFFNLSVLQSCKSSEEPAPSVKEQLDIDASYRNIEVDRASATVVVPLITNLSADNLIVEQSGTWFVASIKEDSENNPVVEIKARENTTGEKRTGSVIVKTSSKLISKSITVVQYGNSTVVVAEDVKIKPISAVASAWETGYSKQGIEYSIDEDFSTHYHSPWKGTSFPITLEYRFAGTEVIDYLIYYTRNGNGNFGKLTIYVATDSGYQYDKLGDYDFGEKSTPSVVQIPGGLKPTGIKFEVKSGFGGFASCAEMEFYKTNTTNPLNDNLLTVFTDLSCSQLKPNVSDEQIEKLGDYFSRVARAIRDDAYDSTEKDFRIRDYEAYSIATEWRDKLMTRTYSILDNPTGIYVVPGEEVIVCVGDTHGQTISLQSIGEEKVTHEKGDYWQPADSGDIYMLKEGVNKLKIKNEGQLFVMYNVSDINSPDAKPIRIHFPVGGSNVTGFFDLRQHKTDEKYAEIISKAKHKYFCVRGTDFIMYFSRVKMPQTKIVGAIELWDDMVKWEQEFCGIDEFRGEGKPFNNHMFGMSPEASNGQLNLWASDNRMAFIWTALDVIVIDKEAMNKRIGGTWGPAHEMGHVHQQAINWEPSTETSANVFAHYVCERLGKYTSHGPGMRRLAWLRAEQSDYSWSYIAKCDNRYNHINNRMWWQLYIYYHKVLGKTDFWKKVFKEMREVHIEPSGESGRKQLEFAKACCRAANENLTDFFDLWGFFVTVNKSSTISGMTITKPMVDETLEYMKQFPKPKHAMEYIEDRKMVGYLDGDFDRSDIGDLGFFETYKNNSKLSSSISAKISGRNVVVSDGNEAVTIEVRKDDENGKLIYFSNFLTFDVPSEADIAGAKVYAVQADGKRQLLGSF